MHGMHFYASTTRARNKDVAKRVFGMLTAMFVGEKVASDIVGKFTHAKI